MPTTIAIIKGMAAKATEEATTYQEAKPHLRDAIWTMCKMIHEQEEKIKSLEARLSKPRPSVTN